MKTISQYFSLVFHFKVLSPFSKEGAPPIIPVLFLVFGVSLFAPPLAGVEGGGKNQGSPYVPGEIIIKLRGKTQGSLGGGVGSSTSSSVAARFHQKMGSRLSLIKPFPSQNTYHFSLKDKKSVEDSVKELSQDPDVEYAEPNYYLSIIDGAHVEEASGEAAGEEGGGGSLTSLGTSNVSTSTANGDFSQNHANVSVSKAWETMTPLSLSSSTQTSTEDRPIVAIIDTGLDYNHSVFVDSKSIWKNINEIPSNGLDDDGNGYIDDVQGWNFYGKNNDPMDDDHHGTHVAGIVVGTSVNIFASSLETSRLQVMPLKFLGKDGTGTTADAISAVQYAIRMGARVINNSWGGANYSQALHEALASAYENGIVIVSAAGNYSTDNDTSPLYPASYAIPSMISVAASNDLDALAPFSNFGQNSVHLSSPGVAIRSTLPGGLFGSMSGTSMAAPFVAGWAALALREAPQLSGYQIRNLILNTVGQIPSLSGKVYTSGRVDAYQVIASVKAELASASYQPSYVPRVPASLAGSGITPDGGGSSTGGGGCGSVVSSTAGRFGAEMRGGGVGDSPSFGSRGGPSSGGGGAFSLVALVFVSILPVLIWYLIRAQSQGRNRRRFDRFVMNSDVRIQVDGRELVGQLSTISLGGVSFLADTLLEKGGVVSMHITGPDGQDQIQVQGHIVWSEKDCSYGVQFNETRDQVVDRIAQWTHRLVKSN